MLVTQATEILASASERLEVADHACPIVSGGGTGTLDLQREAGVLVIDEEERVAPVSASPRDEARRNLTNPGRLHATISR
jgi:hypothetical protein